MRAHPGSDDLGVVSGVEAIALNAHATAGNRLHARPKSTSGHPSPPGSLLALGSSSLPLLTC
jgi:hypothetical protein